MNTCINSCNVALVAWKEEGKTRVGRGVVLIDVEVKSTWWPNEYLHTYSWFHMYVHTPYVCLFVCKCILILSHVN